MIITFSKHYDKFDPEDIRLAEWWTDYLKKYLKRNGDGNKLDDVILYAVPIISPSGVPAGFFAEESEESLDIKRTYSIMVEIDRIKEVFSMRVLTERVNSRPLETSLEADLLNFKRIHRLLRMYIFR